MMQSFAMMALITLCGRCAGYSLVFGAGNPFIGDLRYLFLRGVGGRTEPALRPHHSHQTFMIYQLMFAINHAGADCRRVCRARALSRHGGVSPCCGRSSYTPDGATWSGAAAAF